MLLFHWSEVCTTAVYMNCASLHLFVHPPLVLIEVPPVCFQIVTQDNQNSEHCRHSDLQFSATVLCNWRQCEH